MLGVRAGDPVDRAQGADRVRHGNRAHPVQAGVTVGRVRRVHLIARADPLEVTAILHLLQQLEVEVTWDTEQVPDARLLKSAEQEIPDGHRPGTGTLLWLLGYVAALS